MFMMERSSVTGWAKNKQAPPDQREAYFQFSDHLPRPAE